MAQENLGVDPVLSKPRLDPFSGVGKAAQQSSVHRARSQPASGRQKGESPAPGEVRGFQDGLLGEGEGPPWLMSGQRMETLYRSSDPDSSNGLQQDVSGSVSF